MGRMVIVGAGIIGTMHAVLARRAGMGGRPPRPRPRAALGLGAQLRAGVGERAGRGRRARRWRCGPGSCGRRSPPMLPGVGFRPDGSMTVAQRPEEVAVLEQVMDRADADERGFRLLGPDEVRAVNPALRGRRAGRAPLHRSTRSSNRGPPSPPCGPGSRRGGGRHRPAGYTFHGGRIVAGDRPRLRGRPHRRAPPGRGRGRVPRRRAPGPDRRAARRRAGAPASSCR